MIPRTRRIRSAWLGSLVLAAGTAHAQPTVYELDEGSGWVRTETPVPGTDAALIAEVRKLLAEDRPGAAQDRIEPWIERNKDTDNPYLAQGWLLLGDAKTARGYEYSALFDYERVITQYPSTPEYIAANEREFEIAMAYANGMRRRVLWGLVRWGDASDLAQELLIRIHERLPGSALAERATIELADFYYRQRDMRMARDAYRLFLENYPRSEQRAKALQRRVLANIALFKGPRYDASGLQEAALLIQEYQDRYPFEAQRVGLDESLEARIDESAGAHMLESARWYLRRGDEPAARLMLKRLIGRHPRTVAAREARTILEERDWQIRTGDEPVEAEPLGPAVPDLPPGPAGSPAENGGGS
ncbi:MAG: outer membrane protein assembly factor BamD [Phycisphaerales bacterium JB037]